MAPPAPARCAGATLVLLLAAAAAAQRRDAHDMGYGMPGSCAPGSAKSSASCVGHVTVTVTLPNNLTDQQIYWDFDGVDLGNEACLKSDGTGREQKYSATEGQDTAVRLAVKPSDLMAGTSSNPKCPEVLPSNTKAGPPDACAFNASDIHNFTIRTRTVAKVPNFQGWNGGFWTIKNGCGETIGGGPWAGRVNKGSTGAVLRFSEAQLCCTATQKKAWAVETCAACPSGKFANGTAATTCISCPAGTIAFPGSAACVPGVDVGAGLPSAPTGVCAPGTHRVDAVCFSQVTVTMTIAASDASPAAELTWYMDRSSRQAQVSTINQHDSYGNGLNTAMLGQGDGAFSGYKAAGKFKHDLTLSFTENHTISWTPGAPVVKWSVENYCGKQIANWDPGSGSSATLSFSGLKQCCHCKQGHSCEQAAKAGGFRTPQASSAGVSSQAPYGQSQAPDATGASSMGQAPAKCSTLKSCLPSKVKDTTKDNFDCAGAVCDNSADSGTCCTTKAQCASLISCHGSMAKDTTKDNIDCAGAVCDVSTDSGTCCTTKAKCANLTYCEGSTVKDTTKDNIDCAGAVCDASTDSLTCCKKKAQCSSLMSCPSTMVKDTTRNTYYCDGAVCIAAIDSGTCCKPAPTQTTTAKCYSLKSCQYSSMVKDTMRDTFDCAGATCSASTDSRTCCKYKAKCHTLTCPASMVRDYTKSNSYCRGATCDVKQDSSTCCKNKAKCPSLASCWYSRVKDTAKANNYCAGATCSASKDSFTCCTKKAKCSSLASCRFSSMVKDTARAIRFCAGATCSALIDSNTCCTKKAIVPQIIRCSFDNIKTKMCGFTESGGNLWERGSKTPSHGTGPPNARNGKYFLYLESSSGSPAKPSYFQFPSKQLPLLSFYYHMFGKDMGTLAVETTADSKTWTRRWSKAGQQQKAQAEPWLPAAVKLPAGTTAIRFTGIRGSSWQGDMGVDAIELASLFSSLAITNCKTHWDTTHKWVRHKDRMNCECLHTTAVPPDRCLTAGSCKVDYQCAMLDDPSRPCGCEKDGSMFCTFDKGRTGACKQCPQGKYADPKYCHTMGLKRPAAIAVRNYFLELICGLVLEFGL